MFGMLYTTLIAPSQGYKSLLASHAYPGPERSPTNPTYRLNRATNEYCPCAVLVSSSLNNAVLCASPAV